MRGSSCRKIFLQKYLPGVCSGRPSCVYEHFSIGISESSVDAFRRGFSRFVEGDWEEATSVLRENDCDLGPTTALLR